MLLPFRAGIGSLVFISSKAVYVDSHGCHSNTEEPPAFDGLVTEEQPTEEIDYQSAAGNGANKVAAENVLLDSGMPVSVLRPSRIHGTGGKRPREWVFVKRVLDGRRHLSKGEAEFRAVTELDPAEDYAWFGLGRSLERQSRHAEARNS